MIEKLNRSLVAQTGNTAEPQPYEPYHASHLHREEQVREILFTGKGGNLDMLNTKCQGIPLVTSAIISSPQNPKPMLTILEEIIDESLRLQWKTLAVCEGVACLAEELYPGARQFVECAPSSWQNDLLEDLRKETKTDFELSGIPQGISISEKVDPQRRTKRPLLAIVGMAGRFPDAADHEKLWSLLEAGLDVHREVSNLENQALLGC